jgi:hypothetical protein
LSAALVEIVELLRPHVSERKLANRKARSFFLFWFPVVSIVLYGGGTLLMNAFSSESFRTAAYFGLGLCTVSSIISFFITEWAVDLPDNVFFGVAFGSVVVRIFTLLFAFAIAQFVFKMNPMGMVSGMFSAYFSYLVIEIAYIHKKSLKRGH